MAYLTFYYSAMNAGKSTQLLQFAHNHVEKGHEVMMFSTALDKRGSEGRIFSRLGIEKRATFFDANTNLRDAVLAVPQQVTAVFLDEAQFLTQTQVLQLVDLVDCYDINVNCYGLKTDFQGQFFPGAEALMRFADYMPYVENSCFCGKRAEYNLRVSPEGVVMREGPQVLIGATTHVARMSSALFSRCVQQTNQHVVWLIHHVRQQCLGGFNAEVFFLIILYDGG